MNSIVLPIVCLFAIAVTAHAQNQRDLSELEQLHDAVVRPETVLERADVRRESSRLAELGLDAAQLDSPHKERLHRALLYIALAEGDAAKAQQHAVALREAGAQDRASLLAIMQAATAAGDAKLANDTLRPLTRTLAASERRAWAGRRMRLRMIGEEAPSLKIETESEGAISIKPRRGKILVIDFWNTLLEPPAEHRAGLRKLWDAYRLDRNVEFVGVNNDSAAKMPEAQQFAATEQYVWPIRYERQGITSPIAKEFRAARPPWTVVIDSFGYIRAIGGASEPGLHYAIRAAVREAAGDKQVVLPRTRSGEQPKLPDAQSTASSSGTDGSQPDAGDGYAPQNADAKRLLDQARTYIRTGLKTKARELLQRIIAEYPGTREAEDAQDYLESLG